jgi:HEPN superfamily RiboL-PSP-like protein
MSGRQEVARMRRRLEATLARAPQASADIEMQADFAKYFCILVSGFLENALIALVLDVAQRKSAPEVALFVERQLDWWTNPNTEKISKLLGDFNPAWRTSIESYLADERKAAVNSLVALRHRIAHGESVGTSLAQVKAYYKTVNDVVDEVANLIGAV